MKKSLKETKIGAFLSSKAPQVLNAIGNVLPDKGTLGIVKNIITSDNSIEPQDKEMAMKLLEQDIAEMQNVSNRWNSDMKSDSWLSKNTRQLNLIYLTLGSPKFKVLVLCLRHVGGCGRAIRWKRTE